MTAPPDVKLLKSHEWARKEGDRVAFGVSDFAVEQLNREIVYLELPEVGRKVAAGDPFGVIEAVKAASDLYAPMSGTVVEVNAAAVENPILVADSPYGDGWLVRVEPSEPVEWENLISAAEYQQAIDSGEAH